MVLPEPAANKKRFCGSEGIGVTRRVMSDSFDISKLFAKEWKGGSLARLRETWMLCTHMPD